MSKAQSYEDIIKGIKQGSFSPVYLLMGEEDYYIDRISDFIVDSALTETEKDFNLTILYGAETDMMSVVNAAQRYPMMAERQVVVLREAQALKSGFDDLVPYLEQPQPSTILVIVYKHGTLDKRKKAAVLIDKIGTMFESNKLKDAQLPGFIESYLKRKGVGIEHQVAELIAEFVGSDLNRLSGELEKLIITLPAGQTRVTAELVERNIGISKDYNNFELRSALISKDVEKVNKIVKYFDDNPKNNPLQMTLAMLFNFYSNLMLAYYAPEKSENGVAAFLGFRSPWQARDYLSGMRSYSAMKVMHIISAIRDCDAKSKGIENSSVSQGELLRELTYFILH